jgi:hypothetical protein
MSRPQYLALAIAFVLLALAGLGIRYLYFGHDPRFGVRKSGEDIPSLEMSTRDVTLPNDQQWYDTGIWVPPGKDVDIFTQDYGQPFEAHLGEAQTAALDGSPGDVRDLGTGVARFYVGFANKEQAKLWLRTTSESVGETLLIRVIVRKQYTP